MRAEIIAIGTELTTGAKLDTNSQWLSVELAAKGIPVTFHSTVADDLPAMVGLLRLAVERSDLVLITGGLGPTLDDLTRQALADLVQAELVLHEPSLAFLKAFFARRNREMPQRNVVQAMFPAGSEVLSNPRGTAPGIWMEVARGDDRPPCRLAALPGVPSEMKPMFVQQVLPRLPGTGNVIRRARVNTFGLGESDVEHRLGDLTARGRDPEIGITAHEATITLRIEAHGGSEAECLAKIDAAKSQIRERLGDLIYGEEDEELEHVVVRMLRERGLALATAEAGTGGLLADRLTDVPGHEATYLGGVIASNNFVKRELLGLDPESDEAEGAISAAAARATAAACRARFGTDFALAVAESPRENPLDAGAAAPATWIAIAGPGLLEAHRHVLIGDPAIAKSRAAKAALNLVRLHLLR